MSRVAFTENHLLEEIGVLYRGLVLGFVIAAPVGPVGLLCIRRTLQKGVVIGMATGLGAACTDALFGAIAVLGVSAVLGFIHHYEASIRLIGGCIVLATAWHTWFDHPKPPHRPDFMTKVLDMTQENAIAQPEVTALGALRAMLSGFIITMTNPLTLFATLAVVATFGAVTRKLEASVLIGGIFAGSALWWVLLSGGVGSFRHHFTENRIVIVNRMTAIGLVALAIWALFSGARGYMR
jgi:threonine/homoserine/homoserine lactone efflux protein